MNLQDRQGAVVLTKTFTHIVWHQDVMHLAGAMDYTVRGRNLHFLAPFLATGLFPENLLQANNEQLLGDVFPRPLSIEVTQAVREKPSWGETFSALPFPLPHKIPCSPKFDAYRWMLVEANDGTAMHPHGDFRFITPCGWSSDLHLVFGAQAYALEIPSANDRDAMKDALIRRLPDPDNGSLDANMWINIFSIYAAASGMTPRFLAKKIRRIDFSEVDTSRLSEMAGPCVRIASLPGHGNDKGFDID